MAVDDNPNDRVMRNIPDRKWVEKMRKAYDDLHQTQQAIIQRERLRATRQLANIIAHHFNNALSPIVGLMDLLLMTELNLSEKAKQYLTHIRTASADMAHIVARMREFYWRDEERELLLPVNLNLLVRQVLELTRLNWGDIPQEHGVAIEVHMDLDPGLLWVLGIETEIRDALTHLIFNAVDAMPAGGVITMRTREAPTSSQVFLEVIDTGVGMNEETRQRCLEPFYSTKGERGAGLGLAVVHGVMQLHEGSMDIESALGQGTTMRLIFPVSAATRQEAISSHQPHGTSRPLRILCIDDEPMLREVIKEMLRSEGHTVEVADGGQAGLDLFRMAKEQGSPFDLVITDLGMPYIDGREVARAVKRESAATPVILLTGWGTRMNAEGAIPPQVDVLLSKPPRLKELRKALAQVVHETSGQ